MNLLEKTYDKIDKIKKDIVEIPLEDKFVADAYLQQRLEEEVLNAINFHEILTEQIDYAHEKSKKFSWMIEKNNQKEVCLFHTDYIQMETEKVNNNYFICIGNYNFRRDFWGKRIGIKIIKKKNKEKISFAYSNNETCLGIVNCPWLAFDNFKPRDLFTLGISYFIRHSDNINYTLPMNFIKKTKKTNTEDKENIILLLKSIPSLIEGGIGYIKYVQEKDKNKIKELMNL